MSSGIVPYITTWSGEQPLPTQVIQGRVSGIAFADETFGDRDEHGVLWRRVPSRPGNGRPHFGQVHPLRQRRTMRRLLCQVCAGPADQSERGTLWLVPDHRGDWPQWPEHMAATEPPVCLPCARTSIRACPALRESHVAIRVGRSEISGVYGAFYRPGPTVPLPATDAILAFDDPAIRWTCAGQLVRELLDCTIVNLEKSEYPLSQSGSG
jgi:hypothetical protein